MIEDFRALHGGGTVLVLPNAWDVASARLVEQAGAAAVATTSAGVAWSLGAPDGDRLPRERAVDLVARVARAVAVPVTADIESGFGATPEEVAGTVRAVAEAGAAGVNLEDALNTAPGLRPVEEQVARLRAARAASSVFLNARVDTYLFGIGAPDSRFAETVARARAYLAAGADGVFVPGVVDRETIGELVSAIDAPLNVLAGPGAPPVAELADLGVARVSVGAGITLAAYARVVEATRELLTAGTYDTLRTTLGHAHLDALLAEEPPRADG